MDAPKIEKRSPELTFPEDEASLLRRLFAQASVVLEYGSGGSTVLAAELAKGIVISVESDRSWAETLSTWFVDNPPKADLRLHTVDIGETKKWGRPVGNASWQKFHRYPISVWDRDDFVHPDVVLIDGRFRAACWLTCMLRCTQPMTVLVDDYVDRPSYHTVEHFLMPTEIVGRMARFDMTPTPFSPEDMALIFEAFTRKE